MGSDRGADDGDRHERDEPRGHVKLARKAFESDPFWLEAREYSRWEAWVDVIQLACYAPYRFRTSHGPVDLARGEFVASIRGLAARFKWNLKRVRVWLVTCEKGARIRAQRQTAAGTVYLIVNYDKYQMQGHSMRTAKGTAEGIAGARQGHKREAVKAVKAVRTDMVDEVGEAGDDAAFDSMWKRYPHRNGSNPRHLALSAWNARLTEGHTAQEMTAGVDRYRRYAETERMIDTPYVMQAKRFLGPGLEFLETWAVAVDANEAAVEAERAKQDQDEMWIASRISAAPMTTPTPRTPTLAKSS